MSDKKGESCIPGLEETPEEKALDIFLFLLFIALILVLVFYVLFLLHKEETAFEVIQFW